MEKSKKYPSFYIFIAGAFIFSWQAILSDTDAYLSVYMLCAAGGIVCFCDNLRHPHRFNRKRVLFFSIVSVFFSIATLLANYQLFEPVTALLSIFNLACGFLGGFLLCLNVMICLSSRLPLFAEPDRKHPLRLFFLVFGSVALVDFLYLMFSAYPGILSRDSISTMRQILQGHYNNTMPFWHTVTVMVFVKAGMAIFGDINRAVAFFHIGQILFLSACFAYAMMSLYQAGVNRVFLALSFGFFLLMPYNIVYSVTLWKDVLFGAAVLLFVTSLYRLLKKIGKSQAGNYCVFILGSMGTCLWRTNGWFAFMITTLIILLLMEGHDRWRIPAVMIGVLIVCWVLISPLLSVLHVAQTDLVEAFAVPFQQIARVIAQGRELTAEDTYLLEQAFHLDKVAALYSPETVDPIKFEAFRSGNKPFIQDNLLSYGKLYFRLGLKYPGDYLKAWIEETKGYWNGGYSFWIYGQGISQNTLGIFSSVGKNPVGSLFSSLFRLLEQSPIFQPLFSIGLFAWIIIGCFLLNLWKRRTEYLTAILPIVLLIGLWIGTPVYAEFRYAYPLFLSAPVIAGATFFSEEHHEHSLS